MFWKVGSAHTESIMPHLVDQLTKAKIHTLTEPKLRPDGRGLYLQITDAGALMDLLEGPHPRQGARLFE